SFGWDNDELTKLSNRGQLTATDLYVANQPFDLYPTDSITNFYLRNGTSTINTPLSYFYLTNGTSRINTTLSYLYLGNSTAATAGTGNVTDNVDIYNSTLTLGADMTLSGALNMWGDTTGSILDMAGHSLNTNQFYFGWSGGTNTLLNSGGISANYLYVGNANVLTLHPGDLIENYINLSNSSMLTVQQANGQLTGLTFNGPWQGSLSINDTSMLNLNFGQSSSSHWIFRWRDSIYTGNWGNALTSLIGAGQISINPSNGYYLADQGGYTYIYAVAKPADFDWKGGNSAGPTDWSLAANWNPNTGVPDGKGVVISFGAQSAVNNIVDLGSDGKTVGGLIFVIATSTTIQSSGGHDLTLDNDGALSTIYVSGNHYITTPVILNNDAQIIGLGTLTLSGGISGPHDLDVQCNLIASSIAVDTLTIGSDSTDTIQSIAGGPSGSTITAVPEPSTLVLMGIGSISLLAYAWRRRWRRVA
ncbi:MAG: PEP-CTERM sorting domain-containing protein, partial [Thermoguttaceae bacterium]